MLTSSKINGMEYDEKIDPKSGFHRGFQCAVKNICYSLECLSEEIKDITPLRAEFIKERAEIIRNHMTVKRVVKHFQLKSPSFRRKQFYVIEGSKDEVHTS